LGELGHGLRVFGFLDEGQAGFDETFRQNQTIELGTGLRHQGKILCYLPKPVQLQARDHVSGHAPYATDRDVDRRRAHTHFRLSEIGVDIFGRHIRRSRCVSSEQSTSIEDAEKVAVMPLVPLAPAGDGRPRLRV
jgi:hypothetical protein